MPHKARLYELMMKREKLALRRKADALGGLVQDQSKLADLDEKLAVLLTESCAQKGAETVHSLRSRAWYGREMAGQREFAQNRLEFLGKEIETAQSRLAQSKQKEKILGERALTERKIFAQEAENNAEKLCPPGPVSKAV